MLPLHPPDATLSVTKTARLLGVHPNTVRAWSNAGRLRYYRINARGDRRFRLGDLQRFLAAAEHASTGSTATIGAPRRPFDPAANRPGTGSSRPASHPSGPAVVEFEPSTDEAIGAERHHRDLSLIHI